MRATRYRWVITCLIFFITLINFIDRSAISYVIEPLKQEFGFTSTEFGMILSAFGLGYMLLTSFGGWMVDMWGARIVWAIAAISWSICIALLGFSGGFWGFIFLRFLLGITEGPHFPAMSVSINNWLPATESAKALSFGLVAIPLSAVIGAPLIAYLVADLGWRAMFFTISVIGIVWAFIWYQFFTNNPADSPYVNEAEKTLIEQGKRKKAADSNIDWRYILTHPALIANNIAYFAYGYMLFFSTLWLPGYFLTQHGLDLKSVGCYLTIPWLVGAVFLKAGGVISDWLYKKTGKGRIARAHLIWMTQSLAAVFFVALGFTDSLFYSLLFLSLGLGFGQMPQSAFFSTNIDVAKERSGSSQGITSSCLSLAGVIAPVITGWLIDVTGNFKAAFLLLGAITALAVVVVILFHHPDRPYQVKRKAEPLPNFV